MVNFDHFWQIVVLAKTTKKYVKLVILKNPKFGTFLLNLA